MTNPDGLTTNELNRWLAESFGWKHYLGRSGKWAGGWIGPDGRRTRGLPNFCGDWRWAGWLVDWMTGEGFRFQSTSEFLGSGNHHRWSVYCWHRKSLERPFAMAYTAPEAITRAAAAALWAEQ